MPTLAEIEAASNAAKLQMAEYVKPRLEGVRDILAGENVAKVLASLEAIHADLPASEDKVQVGNILTVLGSLGPHFTMRAEQCGAAIAALTPPPPAPPEAPPPPPAE